MKYAVSAAAIAAALLAACSEQAADTDETTDAAPVEETGGETMSDERAPGDAVSGDDASEDGLSEASADGDETDMASSESAPVCEGFGPQTPRDISMTEGTNPVSFELAPPASELNLCNIHTHTNAEHKGPGFSVYVGDGEDGGFACNETAELTEEELTDPMNGEGAFGGVAPGDTIEVHWVHSSCDVEPGEGLGSCLTDACENPLLRVEAQAFLVVNDPEALDFTDFGYAGSANEAGLHQAASLPEGSGDPVVFRGSTTGPSYDEQTCSPLQVTWSVRPQCLRVDVSSLHRWAEEGNVFNETESHGVRELVTSPDLLAPIESE
ncbi:MAG: delta-class carbonic anhydrase [Oceanicaulis sp.]